MKFIANLNYQLIGFIAAAVYAKLSQKAVIRSSMSQQPSQFCQLGLAVIENEARAVAALSQRIGVEFEQACQAMLDCKGRIIVMGMGKSGHIAGKIAATLASTGSPAFFVHPAEASHGDMGMITANDVVLALSYSGNSSEIITLIPLIKRLGIPLITLTGKTKSPMATAATINIDVSVDREACPLGLAPTTSTTASLAMGDALAVALLNARGFTAEDFAFSHPGGQLGRRLLLRVKSIMHTGDKLPLVTPNTTLSDTLLIMTEKKLGMACIVTANNTLCGVFTDGDLRRSLSQAYDPHTTAISKLMSRVHNTINKNLLAVEALKLMEQHKITSLIITEAEQVIGVVHMHDILQAGLA